MAYHQYNDGLNHGETGLTDNKDNDLAKKIYEENVRVHRLEAPIYERIHPEIFNPRVQRELQEELSLVRKLLPSPNLNIICLDIIRRVSKLLSLHFLRFFRQGNS